MTDERFDQIMRQALSPQIPDEKLNTELIRKMEGEQMKKKNVFGSALVVAASVAVLGTCAFAANMAYRAFTEQTATYQYSVNIEPESEAITSSTPMKLVLNGVPEDLHYNEDGPYVGKYHTDNPDDGRALTPNFMKVPESGIHESIDFATGSETWTTESGNTAMFVERDQGYDQVWISFAGTEYVAQLYVNGFTMEEVKILAEGAELVEAEEELAGEWFDRYETADDTYVEEVYTLDEENVLSVGDSFPMPWLETIKVTVDSIRVQDDFTGITTDSIGNDRDYSSYLTEDGKIQSTWQVVKLGDGAEALDQILKEEPVTYKIVAMDLTFSNTSDIDDAEVCICPRIVAAEDGMIRNILVEEEGIYINPTDDLYRIDGDMISFSTEHAHSKNNLVQFKPGETTEVQVAFVLTDNQLENAYMQPVYERLEKQPYFYLGDL